MGDEGGDDVPTLLGVVVTVGDSNPVIYNNKFKKISIDIPTASKLGGCSISDSFNKISIK